MDKDLLNDLDEAIKHCEEVAQEKRYEYQECLAVHDTESAMDCEKCGEEHEQLAEWLKDYKRLLEERTQGEWIYGEDECGQDGWFCSECDFFVPWYYQYYEKDIDFIRDYKVCPHCLAEMITYTGKDRNKKGGTEC